MAVQCIPIKIRGKASNRFLSKAVSNFTKKLQVTISRNQQDKIPNAEAIQTWFTPLYQVSLRIYELTYGHLPSLALQIYESNGTAAIQEPQVSKGTVAFLIVQTIFLPIYTCLILKSVFSKQYANNVMHMLRDLLSIFIVSWLIIISTISRVDVLRGGKSLSSSINNILQQKIDFNRKFPFSKMFSGLLLLYLNVVVVLFATPFPFVLVYIKWDFVSWLFEESGTQLNIFSWIVLRTSFITWFWIGARDCVVGVMISFFLFTALQMQLHAFILNSERNSLKVLKGYITSRILYTRIEPVMNNLAFNVMLLSQIMLTIWIWLPVNFHDIAPVFISLICTVGFVEGLGLTINYFYIQAATRVLSESLVIKNTNLFEELKGNARRILQRKWRAQVALPIKCGSHFSISTTAIMNYLKVLSDNITNALLLIHI